MTTENLTIEPLMPSNAIPPYQEAPGEEYMNLDQKKHFQALLLQAKRQLLDTSKQTLNQLQDEGTVSPDMSDQATREEAFRTRLRTHGREYQLIKKIDDALHLLKREIEYPENMGNYGYCEACGGKIGIQRLEARPTATLCIDCKTLDEIREKQQGN